jgi:hypothetical protein
MKRKVSFTCFGNLVPITIIGKDDNVKRAVTRIKELLSNQESYITTTIEINRAYHAQLIGYKAVHLKKIMSEFGVQVQFPTKDENSSTVGIKGPQEKVIACINKLNEIVAAMANVVTKELRDYPKDFSNSLNAFAKKTNVHLEKHETCYKITGSEKNVENFLQLAKVETIPIGDVSGFVRRELKNVFHAHFENDVIKVNGDKAEEVKRFMEENAETIVSFSC